MKMHMSNKQNVSYEIISVEMLMKNSKWKTRNWMGPLNEENKLQVDEENNKNWKCLKNFWNV